MLYSFGNHHTCIIIMLEVAIFNRWSDYAPFILNQMLLCMFVPVRQRGCYRFAIKRMVVVKMPVEGGLVVFFVFARSFHPVVTVFTH